MVKWYLGNCKVFKPQVEKVCYCLYLFYGVINVGEFQIGSYNQKHSAAEADGICTHLNSCE